jgi:hypothetical protein
MGIEALKVSTRVGSSVSMATAQKKKASSRDRTIRPRFCLIQRLTMSSSF